MGYIMNANMLSINLVWGLDMENQALYKWLTAICKKKGIRIEKLPEACGFSRSSLYRYMKGINRMTTDVQNVFASVLHLDSFERSELNRLVELTQFDSSLIAARYALDKLVFGIQEPVLVPEPIKFAYYDNDTFLRTSNEIFNMILNMSDKADSVCQLKVINCMDAPLSKTAVTFLGKLVNTAGTVLIEHLVNFSDRDYLKNTEMLINVIPLLQYKSYSVYYSAVSIPDEVKMMFRSAIFAEVHPPDETAKYFFISFLEDDLSVCHSTQDKYAYTFFISNYEQLKKNYNAALLAEETMESMIQNTIITLEESYNSCLIKPNNCYDKIPMEVYRSLVARQTAEKLDTLVRGFGNIPDEVPIPLGSAEAMLSLMERRISASYKNERIDVYSADGLTSLAQTGKLTDHCSYIPVFEPSERRTILEYIRDRNNDPDDKYKLYITRESVFKDGYIVVAFEGFGICIEYIHNRIKAETHDTLMISNKMMSEVFMDYVKNHIPAQHAMSPNEANEFLNGLIESLNDF